MVWLAVWGVLSRPPGGRGNPSVEAVIAEAAPRAEGPAGAGFPSVGAVIRRALN